VRTLSFRILLLNCCLLLSFGLGARAFAAQFASDDHDALAPAPTVSTTVLARYPHDPSAYTQGLTVADGVLYEGTGWYGESTLRRVDLLLGSVLQQVALPPEIFGEGITVVGDRILQLTWRSHLGYVYDRSSFAQLRTFTYPTEGWGLTYDGTRLVMSDGSATLRFLDAETLAEVGQIQVRAGGQPVQRLNELEYVNGVVFANVYQSDQVAAIDPTSGEVQYWIDLSQLNPAQQATGDEVLNGIAYDAQNQRLLVTGKRWPTLFEIRVDHTETSCQGQCGSSALPV
jgi:glutaminyl-peptide cyclotransferase